MKRRERSHPKRRRRSFSSSGALPLWKRSDRGEREIADAIPDLAFILGDGEASPAPLNLHDVLRPWHDGSAETQTLIYNWGRTASPAAMRKWFNYDRAKIPQAAERLYAELELGTAAD